jgi:branched-subunit amino acid transport protein AzlD
MMTMEKKMKSFLLLVLVAGLFCFFVSMTLSVPAQFESVIMSEEMDNVETGSMAKTSIAGSIMIMVSSALLAIMMVYCMFKSKKNNNTSTFDDIIKFGKRLGKRR